MLFSLQVVSVFVRGEGAIDWASGETAEQFLSLVERELLWFSLVLLWRLSLVLAVIEKAEEETLSSVASVLSSTQSISSPSVPRGSAFSLLLSVPSRSSVLPSLLPPSPTFSSSHTPRLQSVPVGSPPTAAVDSSSTSTGGGETPRLLSEL